MTQVVGKTDKVAVLISSFLFSIAQGVGQVRSLHIIVKRWSQKSTIIHQPLNAESSVTHLVHLDGQLQ